MFDAKEHGFECSRQSWSGRGDDRAGRPVTSGVSVAVQPFSARPHPLEMRPGIDADRPNQLVDELEGLRWSNPLS